ncbi:nicotinamide mononucleotide transporter family protein [Chryseobacterium sp. D764]|uniref:nicotinamide mononucleotide transporter family protein n=1 Tax=unclassified Chryseobacterium TaxID=2593645 RepID=UPI001C5767AA|nr:nicotinamide mononucleotide transporter family protein [Chryseobacterium sp. D764]QXU48794.1 nicotinamide mononucleotide transporter family protein [Chryseobacterium sp. D764]
MELRIKPFPKNNYPKTGLLIRGSSPVVWLQEMEMLGINVNQIRSYAIPADNPNVLYGCFLVFTDNAPQEIGRNAYFQCVDNRLFIPENTTFYPKINPEDWAQLDSRFLIMHPEFGLVKLSEEIDWISLIQQPGIIDESIRKPLNGVSIPQKIESYTVEIDDEKVMEALQPKQTEEEWMNNLPFDLKKVMAGNKKEIEKYLQYIEKYPERAVDLGVSLDVMGTSRGDGFGKFTWLEGLFGGGSGGKTDSARTRNLRRIFWAVIIVAIVLKIALPSDKNNPDQEENTASSGKIANNAVKAPSDMIAFQSGISEIDLKIDSIYHQERKELSKELIHAGIIESKTKEDKENYKKAGGREVSEIGRDIGKLVNKEKQSRDSLKTIYTQKITKHLEQNTEKLKRKISDSLKQYTKGKPVNGEVVKFLLKKRKALMADSLGKLYGTFDIVDPSSASIDKSKVKAVGTEGTPLENKAPVSDIMYMVILMIAGVGLYLFLFKNKSLNLGGDNVPVWVKFILIAILVVMLVYLFYPLVKMFGYNWFVWVLVICVMLLLYRLFRDDKTILKSDDDE